MTRDEHKALTVELLQIAGTENQARVSEILTNLSDDYEETLTSLETSETNVSELTKNNEALRKVNADLFLKVGNSIPNPKTEPPGDDTPPEVKTFDSLFNEKGELI